MTADPIPPWNDSPEVVILFTDPAGILRGIRRLASGHWIYLGGTRTINPHHALTGAAATLTLTQDDLANLLQLTPETASTPPNC